MHKNFAAVVHSGPSPDIVLIPIKLICYTYIVLIIIFIVIIIIIISFTYRNINKSSINTLIRKLLKNKSCFVFWLANQ